MKTLIFDAVCETQAELLAAITSSTVHTILWRGGIPLTDLVATAGTFKIIYCQHNHLLGKNSTLVAPAGKNITIYGDFDCDTPATGGYSWTLNCTSTSSIKCKWIHNSGVTGKIICDTGTVLYERLESGLTLETNGAPGSESYINQEFWDNTNDNSGAASSGILSMETMLIGSANASVSINAGSTTQWAGQGTRINPLSAMEMLATSIMKISMPQVVSGGSLIFGLFSHNETTRLNTLKMSSPIITMPTASSDIAGVLSHVVSNAFSMDEKYYACVFTDSNGCAVRGVAGSNMNFLPYTSGIVNNLGVLTEAPASFTFEGETGNNIFVRVTK
ncbi:MAG: hypothetical protein WC165_11045 [Dysgonamonadaceae bacterium]